MKKIILAAVFIIALFITTSSNAQVGIGVSTSDRNPSAQLDVFSTTKGLLPPRMTTTQRDAIVSPASGLVIFNTTTNSLEYKSSTGWVLLAAATPTVIPDALPTIQIGIQKWMTQNLNTSFYRNGDTIPYVTDATAWAGLTTGAWCYYNNDPANGEIYGKLYNWYAVKDSTHGGLAPLGWHIPTDAEWTTLTTTTLGGLTVAGGKMKSAGTTRWTTPNTGATNSSGFAGLPGGYRNSFGSFGFIGSVGGWWSSTEDYAPLAWSRYLYYDYSNVYSASYGKTFGFSVRCLRD
jgi:uncharacterized protein (TIGR02145 family)